MGSFRILNSRKRAIIALVHSIAFGLLAGYQLMTHSHPRALVASIPGHAAGSVLLASIYLVVSVVLLMLVVASRGPLEKLYFAFCATSAGIGLLRVVLGDPTVYAANLMRVLMLGCGVLTGTLIMRLHSPQPELAKSTSM